MEESSPPGAWAVFISQIFEQDGAVSGILETLKDGPPKLQQAYLNIINLIFTNNTNDTNNINHSDNELIQNNGDNLVKMKIKIDIEIDKALHTIRSNLSHPEGALPCILRLIEQGGSSSVRSKALLAAQLLCRYSPHLLTGTQIFCL